jgi:hypothetical protein
VTYADDAITCCEKAIARIEEMKAEGIQGQVGMDALEKDKQRFQAAIDTLLLVIRD